MNEELKNALGELKTELEGKSKEQVKNEIKSFEEKNKELIKAESKSVFEEEIKSIKEALEADIKSIQEHADKLDVKLQSKQLEEKKENVFVKAIKEHYNESKGIEMFSVEYKDMTLGSALTGDQPRQYNNDVVMRPPQMVNVEDLAQTINIAGGTYTYTRSTLSSGSVGAQTEGALKNQLEYNYEMVDANTDFIAGFVVYSKKMRNNLPFLTSTVSEDLRNDYYRGENSIFEGILSSQATASTEVITGKNKVEMLINEIAKLADIDFSSNGIVIRPSDYYDILKTEKSTGAGYGLPGIVTFDNGVLRINGIPVFQATWLPANKYYVGNWSRVRKVVTEGFSFEISEEDSDNFRKNNITARVESQSTLTVEQPDALVYGDFTAV